MSSSSDAARTFTETARRAQLVQAAITTVNELGYPRASLAEIARRAGVAKSAIVYYFASKDTLLLHVVDHVFTALEEARAKAVAAHTEPAARLRAYAESHLAYVDAHRPEITAGIEIVVSHRGPDGVPLYLTATDEDTALLRAILGDGMAQGVFRQMPLRIAVDVVEALLDTVTTQLQRDLTADLTALRAEITTIVFRGLAVPDRAVPD
ncbi:TetR/AcrR family transcriptional regulator [Streptomyces sp. 184]|uniref:TetR/AcrR family transcriptional regulator n=1 Tax=Streptomyces sp. 184 TaxID=1827526 RepID=UPI003892020B